MAKPYQYIPPDPDDPWYKKFCESEQRINKLINGDYRTKDELMRVRQENEALCFYITGGGNPELRRQFYEWIEEKAKQNAALRKSADKETE